MPGEASGTATLAYLSFAVLREASQCIRQDAVRDERCRGPSASLLLGQQRHADVHHGSIAGIGRDILPSFRFNPRPDLRLHPARPTAHPVTFNRSNPRSLSSAFDVLLRSRTNNRTLQRPSPWDTVSLSSMAPAKGFGAMLAGVRDSLFGSPPHPPAKSRIV